MIELAPLLLASLFAPAPEEPEPRNLSVVPTSASVGGSLVVMLVNERASGEADFNGDGDILDDVAFVYDADTFELHNLGWAAARPSQNFIGARPITSDGRFVAFAVRESAQGASDLNGDGDTGDDVLQVYDHVAGTVSNLAIAVEVPWVVGEFGDTRLFFVAGEAAQGTDLNGDGDLIDQVAHVLDPVGGEISNLGLAVVLDPFAARDVVGDTFAFLVDESAQGASDLNGDGDASDHVVFLHWGGEARTTNLGLANRSGLFFSNAFYPPFAVPGGPLPFFVPELEQGADLNIDGDVDDQVLHLVDPETHRVSNLGVASFYAQVSPDGRHVAIGVYELAQGRDLNGDGDRFDIVVHLWDCADGSLTNLKVVGVLPRFTEAGNGAWNPQGVARPGSAGVRVEKNELLLMDAPEGLLDTQRRYGFPPSGGGDLTGDGDAFDQALVYYDLREERIRLTGLAVADSLGGFLGNTIAPSLVAVRADELGAGEDKNGDGDLQDFVIQVFDTATREISNVGAAIFCCDPNVLGSFLEAQGTRVLIPVHEASQGGADLNADGDAGDHVLHVFDASKGRLVNHQIAVDRLAILRDGGLFAFFVPEQDQGVDLNGDGDVFDAVLHVLDVR